MVLLFSRKSPKLMSASPRSIIRTTLVVENLRLLHRVNLPHRAVPHHDGRALD